MKTLTIATKKKDEVVDITDTVETALQEMKAEDGLCFLFAAHTTCALTTADLDPGTDRDLLDALRRVLPHISYRHPHDPSHTLTIFSHPSSVHPSPYHTRTVNCSWERGNVLFWWS